MADGQGVNYQPMILNLADDAKITDTIAPQTGEFAAQRLAEMTRVAGPVKPRLQPVEDARRCGTIEFFELLLRERGNLNRLGQAIS